jgi:SAM-dependent methyltransferase
MSKLLLTSFRNKLRIVMDHLIDKYWGIDTLAGTWAFSERTGKFEDATQNVPISYYNVFRFLGRTAFRPDDVFYDIGCGNGRVLCYVARKRVSKVIGVELSRAFADKAEANARKLRGRLSPIEVRCGDAVEMDYSDGTMFFFYNPFGSNTLQAVLANIQKTLNRHRRPICLMYHNPAHSSVFKAAGWIKYAGKRTDILSKQQMELWTYADENLSDGEPSAQPVLK